MCPRECFALCKRTFKLVLCYKKDWAILLHLCYYCYLLLITNYITTKLFITITYNTCREYLVENRLSFPSAPRWVRHSHLLKGLLTPILVGHQGSAWAAWRRLGITALGKMERRVMAFKGHGCGARGGRSGRVEIVHACGRARGRGQAMWAVGEEGANMRGPHVSGWERERARG